jgi:adenylate kinase
MKILFFVFDFVISSNFSLKFSFQSLSFIFSNPIKVDFMKLLFITLLSCIFAVPSFAQTKKPEVIILLGAPASGKGTQAKFITKELNIPQISTGDLFRENIKNSTELGKEAQTYINKGQLVPDSLVLDMLFDRIKQKDAQNGYLLDGFPRTVAQAEAYGDKVKDSVNLVVININVPEEILFARIAERQKIEGRSDDTQEIASERLKVYKTQTLPLIAYYKDKGFYNEVEGNLSIQEVQEQIKKILAPKS